MASFWNSVTEPQATILAAFLTVIAAVAGVMLGAWLFGGRVKDLKGALDRSKGMLQDHQTHVEEKLKELSDVFDAQLTAMQEALGQLRGSVGVLEGASTDGGTVAQADARQKLRDDWAAIRDNLERIAAAPDIDGRTRAKYGRIDRRSYGDLIDCLESDDMLGQRTNDYRAAVALFQKYRNGRLAPNPADLKRMAALRAELAAA